MTIEEAQRDVSQQFAGGFYGQPVSGVLWALSAGFATWGSRRYAIAVLIIGGFFIFPLMFGVLAMLLVGAGLGCGLYRAGDFSLGAWLTAGAPVSFAFVGGAVARTERSRAAVPSR